MPPQKFMEESSTTTSSFTGESDICQQLLHRYGKSVAPHHRHLCETAADTRSIIESKSLPLTPLSYFGTIIHTLSHTSKTTRDADAVSALLSFLAIVLPLVPAKSIPMSKAAEAVEIVVEGSQVSSVRALPLVECLGVLLDFCDLEDWESVQLGFQTLIEYLVDEHPQVRKCAQDCVVKVFKSFQSSHVIKRASKSVLKSFKTYMSLAVETASSTSVNGFKDDEIFKCEYLEVLHMFDLLKPLIPCLPSKFILKVIVELQKSICTQFSPLTTHILDFMEEILGFFESESGLTIIDTVALANKWNGHYSLVIGSIAGLLASEATATRASNILIEMMKRVDISENVNIREDVDNDEPKELEVVKSLCDALLQVLTTHKGTPNEHSLSVISYLYRRLGIKSYTYMGNILLKLASFMTIASGNTCDVKHLQECIGSAVVGMGPEKALELLPISPDADGLTFSNTWFIPILKDYVTESSLGFFIQTIVPLAKSFQEACQKGTPQNTTDVDSQHYHDIILYFLQVKENSVLREQLHSHEHGCWGLLPAFCRDPYDMEENFGSLAKLMIPHIKKDSLLLENIAIALQHLVKQNKKMSFLSDDEASRLPMFLYVKKTAIRNINAFLPWSGDLLKVFTKVFFEVSPEKHAFVEETIRCLAHITNSSRKNAIFSSSLRMKLNVSVDKVKVGKSPSNTSLILKLALSYVGTTGIDPTDYIYNSINECLQEEDGNIQREAYATLYKILVECPEFRSSKFEQLMDLLFDLKSPVDVITLRWRFSCFKTLLVHSIEIYCDGENMYGFRILNEIIVTPKDFKEESKVADETLLETSSILQNSSSLSKRKRGPYYEFINMIMGYLSGSSPHQKSGAVCALSLLISNDSKICHLMPDCVPSILQLLNSEDNIQVIKAVLEFIEVTGLNLQVRDLQKFRSDILGRLLPWSTVSEHHVKSKVTLILEIMMQKCGSATVISLAPEKYRDFVKNVLENRPSSSKDVTDSSDRTPNSGPKRKHNEESSRQTGKRKEVLI